MTTLDRILLHVEQARLLHQLAATVVMFTGDEDHPDAKGYTQQANEHLDAAAELIAQRPLVAYLTVGRGVLVALDEHAPAEWVRVQDTASRTERAVHWTQIAEPNTPSA